MPHTYGRTTQEKQQQQHRSMTIGRIVSTSCELVRWRRPGVGLYFVVINFDEEIEWNLIAKLHLTKVQNQAIKTCKVVQIFLELKLMSMIAYFEKYFCDTKANTSSEIENFNTANGNVRWLKLKTPSRAKMGLIRRARYAKTTGDVSWAQHRPWHKRVDYKTYYDHPRFLDSVWFDGK